MESLWYFLKVDHGNYDKQCSAPAGKEGLESVVKELCLLVRRIQHGTQLMGVIHAELLSRRFVSVSVFCKIFTDF